MLLLGAIVFLLARSLGPAVATARVTRRALEQHLVASGRVWVPTRVQVSAQTAGLVVAVGVLEGQSVKAGDLLVQIDDAEARAAVAQAKAAVDQARARVDQLRRVGAIVASEALRQAEASLAHAETEHERVAALRATGAIAQAQLDDAEHALAVARAKKSAAEAQQLASAPMGADSRVALGALLQAEAQLTGANVRLSQTRIVSRTDGVVLDRMVEPGDTVQPGRTLLVMAADGDIELVLEPDERNLAWIRVGQKARASADAYPQSLFDAEVSYIAPSIDPARGSVEVRLRVPNPPALLKPDMTVSVDLTVASKKDVLTIPSEAVRGAATPTPFVLAVENGRGVRKDVSLGIRGEGTTEIDSGVAEGAEVILARGQAIEPGQRVRPELARDEVR